MVAGANAKLSIVTCTSVGGGAGTVKDSAGFTSVTPVAKVMPKICGPLSATMNAVKSAIVDKIHDVGFTINEQELGSWEVPAVALQHGACLLLHWEDRQFKRGPLLPRCRIIV